MLVPTVTADAIAINSLYSITLFLAVIVFLIVQGLLIYAAAKFKRKHANEIPVQDHGNMKLELFWTVVPAFVVIMLFFLSVNTLAQMSGTGTSASPINNVHKVGDDNARRRIEEAKREWDAQRFGVIPGDEHDFLPTTRQTRIRGDFEIFLRGRGGDQQGEREDEVLHGLGKTAGAHIPHQTAKPDKFFVSGRFLARQRGQECPHYWQKCPATVP